MILQYFKKKENQSKIKSDKIYLDILNKSKVLVNKKYFKKINFNTSFELISLLLICYLKSLKDKNNDFNKKVNEELIKNLINDLDISLRDLGVSDMSIGKHVKKYVKKFYYRLKILDPIFEINNRLELLDYLNSLEFINKNKSSELVFELLDFFVFIKKNND